MFTSWFRFLRRTWFKAESPDSEKELSVTPPQARVGPKPIDGTIAIRDKRIIVMDPEYGGEPAEFFVPELGELAVYVDGSFVTGRFPLRSNQSIEIQNLVRQKPQRQIEVLPADDILSVSLRVTIESGEAFQLTDTEPVQFLKLNARWTKTYPEPMMMEELEKLLDNRGFIGELDHDALFRLANTIETLQLSVLAGHAPDPGRPAHYREMPVPKERDPLHLNMKVKTVPTGHIVGVFVPEIPPRPGVDIYGNPIMPIVSKSLPKLGEGVLQIGAGQLMAAREGRLEFTDRLIDVIPAFVVPGNLQAKDGYIVFNGDVIVLGDVMDGSSIWSTGHVIVHGNCYGGNINAEDGITIEKHVVGSELLAGFLNVHYRSLIPLLSSLVRQATQMKDELLNLLGVVVGNESRRALLPQLLLKKRFPELIQNLAQFANDYKGKLSPFDRQYESLQEKILTQWLSLKEATLVPEDIDVLEKEATEYLQFVRLGEGDRPANVRMHGVSSSMVYATGNIYVHGLGVFNSELVCEKRMLIRGKVRGRWVQARRSIFVNELGSPSGVLCKATVTSRKGWIGVRLRHPNTELAVGRISDRNEVPQQRIYFDHTVVDTQKVA